MAKPEPFANARKATKTIVLVQLAITLLAAALGIIFFSIKAAYSAVIGGGISVIVTLYFAQRVFSLQIGTPANKIMQRFYVGEASKLLLTAALFGITIAWLDVLFPPLFLTYVATLLAYWLVLPFSLDASVKTL